MSEFQIKLEAIGEYQDALRYKKINEELTNSLLGLLNQVFRYCEKNGVPMPEEISRVIDKATELVDARKEASKVAAEISH
jgi:NTP pyrophosphatase (non-canonical NTP hydrolase)